MNNLTVAGGKISHRGYFFFACTGIFFLPFCGLYICSLMADVTQQSVSWCLQHALICWQAFQESICHCLQKYCLNYSAALLYLDNLKPREDFGIYVKVRGRGGGNHWERLNCVRESELWQGRHVTWQRGAKCKRGHTATSLPERQTNSSVSPESCQREECDHFSHV